MGNLRVLFIGGSGVISSACSQVAVNNSIELFVLNRVTDASLDAVMDKLAAAWTG
jgi:hypothetical protein